MKKPTVIKADPIDGLIKTIDLLSELEITVPAWDDANPGDSYQPTINKMPVGTKKFMPDTPPVPGTPMPTSIPLEDIDIYLNADGHYDIGYLTITQPGNFPTHSEPTSIEVDRTPPGQNQLGYMDFPEQVKDGLTLEELDGELDGVLPCGIFGYSGLKRGDTIQTFWGSTPGPSIILDGTEDESQPIPVIFSKAFLLQQGQAEQVYYVITDRAGNTSLDSRKTTILLFLTEIVPDLPAPFIEDHIDPIDYDEAQAGVDVQIPGSELLEPGDKITLHWGSLELGPFPIDPDDIEKPVVLVIDVDFDTIDRAGDGPIRLTYDVIRGSTPIIVGRSLPYDIVVHVKRPVPGELARPIVRGRSELPNNEDNFIDENDFELDADIIIEWNSGFVAGELIEVFWGGISVLEQPYPISDADIIAGRPLSLTALNSKFKPVGTGTDIRVNYTVTEIGNPNIQPSIFQGIIVRSKEELPGGPDGPTAPEFTDLNENGAINPVNGLNGAPVHIEPYDNIKVGDTIHFLYEGFDRLIGGNKKNEWPHTSPPLTLEQTINGYDLRIPRLTLLETCFGHVEATFRVDSVTGSGNSGRANVYIDMRFDC
ncbi:hypothetical protein [Pseudomonas asplenii]|uniref:hypothetical protein n=1 Tax=Pseudomonas asplenii TaxID=53407 RepID=UPI001E574FD3|nr:hypothetical protein [Pseudomonas fuscovaginae]